MACWGVSFNANQRAHLYRCVNSTKMSTSRSPNMFPDPEDMFSLLEKSL